MCLHYNKKEIEEFIKSEEWNSYDDEHKERMLKFFNAILDPKPIENIQEKIDLILKSYDNVA